MPEGPIFIHGGGNFGDMWVAHQDFRERVLERFPDRQHHPVPAVDPLQIDGTRSRQSARVIGTPQELRAAGARRGVEAVRREAFRLRRCGCARTWRSASARCSPPHPSSRCSRCCARTSRRPAATEQLGLSRHPDRGLDHRIRQAGAPRKALGARRRCWRSSRPRCGCASSTPRRTTASGAASGRSPAGSALVTDRLHVHICSLLLGRAACRARQQLRQDPALHGRLLGRHDAVLRGHVARRRHRLGAPPAGQARRTRAA